MRLIRGLLWTVTVPVCLAMFVSAYAGQLSPTRYPGACLAVMTFPIWMVSMAVVTVLDLLLCRRALLAVAVTVASCLPAIWDNCPLNVLPPKAPEGARTFTMLTYNVTNFEDLTRTYPDSINPTMSYIINSGADIVNLQECQCVYAAKKFHISERQVDSLYRMYPYVVLGSYSQTLLSKYPVKVIDTGAPVKSGNEIAVFRVNIEGEQVTIFDVHLQSYQLSRDDKTLYHELTDMGGADAEALSEIRTRLVRKIQRAAEGREHDAYRLGRYIARFGGPNVIVAGDFNDVPGCYTLNLMSDYGLQEVYPEVGFGPMITFNSNRFYFRIDHVLYRGALKPLSMSRGYIKCSDHYPLLVRFALTGD